LQNKTTQVQSWSRFLRPSQKATQDPMIDLKTLENELHHARLARIDAQAAGADVEELIWHVQHFRPGRQRLVFMIDGGDHEPQGPAN